MAPSGRGAYDVGVFDWLRRLEVRYALIRQINNPLAGLDYGLLAFTGIGVLRKMSFGLASCSRPVGAAEGVNVLCERKTKKGFAYTLTNVELGPRFHTIGKKTFQWNFAGGQRIKNRSG